MSARTKMILYPANLIRSSKGISLITIIILVAFLFAGLNAYAYFNPEFTLSKYTIPHLLGSFNDDKRKAELEKIQAVVEKFYDDNGEYPGRDGWCGRIITVLHPEVKDDISGYFDKNGIPQDPAFAGTSKDYFYYREDRNSYVLMAVLENPPPGSKTYNYEGCHDWPGEGVYNYQISGLR